MSITGSGTDSVSGTGPNDSLTGLSGTGASTMSDSGAGATFNVTSTSDIIADTSTGGVIDSTVTWSLATHTTGVNNLTLTGAAAITGTGNTAGDVLTSSTTGTDTLVGSGSAGNDTFILNHAGDSVTENGAGLGGNAINSAITYSLASVAGTNAASVDHLTLTNTTGTINATGNAVADTLVGGATTAYDVLVAGSAGADTLIGHSTVGKDTFTVDNTSDAVTETSTATTALINSNVSFDLATGSQTGGNTGVNNLTLANTGTVTATGTGNTSADILTSSSSATDALIGDSTGGGDTFYVNHAGDTVTENGSNTGDLVSTAASFDLATNGATLNNLTLTGTGHGLTATGSSNAGTLTDATTGTGGNALIGDGGTDTFVLSHTGDTATESNGSGGATVDSAIATTLTANMTNLNMTNTGATVVTGTGNTSADVLTGSASGVDALVGKSALGNDTFHLNYAGDTATETTSGGSGAVVDLVDHGAATNFLLGANIETLNLNYLTGTGNDTGTGNAAGGDTITGSTGNDSLSTASGALADRLIGESTTGSDTFALNLATDTVTETNGTGIHALIKSALSFDLLTGSQTGGNTNVNQLTLTGSGNDTGTGNDGADTLTSNTGTDTLIGNSSLGNDTFYVTTAGDSVTENTASGGAGDIALVNSTVSFALGANIEALNLTNTGTNVATGTGNSLNDVLTSSTAATDTLIGDGLADTFYLNHAGDSATENNASGAAVVNSSISYTLGAHMADLILTGGGTALTGAGNTGTDILTSNTGTDTLIGLSATNGTDTFVVHNTGDHVSETHTGTSTALIQSTVTWSLATNTTNVNELQLINTTGTLSATGNAVADAITGGATSTYDVLTVGTAGLDTMTGNSTIGADTFNINNTNDVLVETTASGGAGDIALVNSSASWTLGSHFEALTLTNTGTVALTGTGNTSADILSVGASTGTDILIGHATSGNDTFTINNTGDVVSEAGSATGDVVNSSVTWALGATHFNALTLTGAAALTGTGNTGTDTLTSSTAGTDTLIGFSALGNDTFTLNHAGDTATETTASGGAGDIALVNSSISYTLGANMEDLTLTGATALTGAGNTLTNVLTSNTGTDTLIGLSSPNGTDTFVVHNVGDHITETNVATTALIESTVAWSLSTNTTHVNNLDLIGTGHGLSAIGNAVADILSDNTTGAGGDTLIGNDTTSGHDTFVINALGDTVSEHGNVTGDIIDAGVNFTLTALPTASFENLTLTAAGITGTGNAAGGDTITGSSAGNDVLSTGTGGAADTLTGEATAVGTHDTFFVNNTSDVVAESGSATGDVVNSSVSWTLGATYFDALTLTGTTAHLTAAGNLLADVLTDNTTDATGGDTLIGDDHAVGTHDTFILNNTGDTVSEAGTVTGDLIEVGVSYTLTSGFEQLTLIGSAGITGTGYSGGGDTIIGNHNNDVLSDGSGTPGSADTLTGNSTVSGPTGGDTFIVHSTGDMVSEAGSTAAALVESGVTWSLASTHSVGVDNLTLTAGAITGTGNSAGGDIITGYNGAGNDVLSVGTAGSADTLIGNSTLGGDTFTVNNAGDSITEAHLGTAALVNSSLSWALGTNFESLTLTGTAALTGTAGATAGTITGNTGADTLSDNAGAATDTLIGNNTAGNDEFLVGNAGDHVTETNAGGTALINATSTFNLYTNGLNINTLNLNGTGTGLTMTGNTANDTITDNTTTGGNVLSDGGHGGHDVLTGGGASDGLNDTFVVSYVGDTVDETDAASTTAEVQSAINYTLGSHLNILTLTGSATQGTASTAGGDTINGDTNNSVLSDNGGAADTLNGGTSSTGDTFMVTNAADVVSEATGSHAAALIDANLASGTFNLTTHSTNVHQLTLQGTANVGGTGTVAGGDTIIGNGGNDTLTDSGNNTGAGDVLEGNSADGGDVFVVNNHLDTITEAGNIGGAAVLTTIESSLGGTGSGFNSLTGLYADFYNLTLTGSLNATGTGNNLANILTGNAGDDLLISGTGVATMTGNATGALSSDGDTFDVNNASDTVTETNSEAGALISSSVNFDLQTGSSVSGVTGVHQLTLTGSTSLTGTGNTAGGDTIINAGTGNDTLSDGGNDTGTADTLEGNSTSGGDTFLVTNSGDTVSEAGSESGAFISSTKSFDLTTNSTGVHQLTLTGTGNETGVGTAAGGDTIIGGTGNDVLSDSGADTGAGDMLVGNSTGGGSGTGADTFILSNSDDTITETNGVSTGTLIESSASYTLGTGFVGLTLIGSGTGLVATGNGSNDTITDITTTGGNTITDGNAGGNDTMIGGDTTAGTGVNDTFVVNNTLDSVTELNASTSSLVEASVNFNLQTSGNGVNNLTLEGTSNLTGTGTSGGGNIISGNTGNDVLSDGTSSPTSADTLIGDSSGGHDTFIVHNATDSVTEIGTAGANLVQAYGTFSLATVAGTTNGVDRLTLAGASGGFTATANNAAGGDTITDGTTAGGNILVSGTTGADVLIDNSTTHGDTFMMNLASDTITENDTHGGTIEFGSGVSPSGYTLGANIDKLTMLSGAGNETITGNTMNDIIDDSNNTGTLLVTTSSTGTDTIYASQTGLDTFILNNAGDSVVGNNTGNTGDIVDAHFTTGSFQLGLNVNNLLITSTGTGHDTIIGNSGSDSINAGSSKSNEFNDGTSGGQDTIYGGGGFDTFILHNSNDIIHEATAGVYLLESYASFNLNNATNIENLTLMGSANITGTGTTTGQSVIVGNTGADVLSDGDNTTGLGDSLYGNDNDTAPGAGDTFMVNNSLDTVQEDGATTHSTVDASVSFTLGTGIANLILTGTGSVSGTGNSAASNPNTIIGNTGADTLSDGGTFITNTLTAHNTDTMIGHSATGDTFMVFNGGDSVTELGVASSGSTIESYASFTLSAAINTLDLEGNAASLVATGNSGADTITDDTSTGGNVLTSGSGVDKLVDANTSVGPTGDTFIIHNASDSITEVAGAEGVIQSYVSFNLQTGVGSGTANKLTLEGTGNDSAVAQSAGHDTLTGNSGHDTLTDSGNTTGANSDHLVGGSGVDTFVISNASDVLDLTAGGTYTISTNLAAGYTLAAGESALIITAASATGTALSTEASGVTITGNGGSDTLVGGSNGLHADTLIGNGGTDTFTIYNSGDHVTETSSSGSTVLNADINTAFSWTLGTNVNTLNVTGAGNDSLTANSGSDTISGSTGSDTIVSGTGGTDALIGNSSGGTDVFYVNHTGDTVTEAQTGTSAVINTTVTFDLANVATGSVSHLILTGNNDATITGDNLGSDTLNASTSYGNDSIASGTGGSDIIYAGYGNDTIGVNGANDTIIGNSSGGNDDVSSGFSFTLGQYIDSLTLTAGGISGTANGDASNTLTGSSAGADTLNDASNGTYADTMAGHFAGDVFNINNASDVLTESVSGGIVNATGISWTLGADMNTLTLVGSAAVTGTGNNGADTITDTTTTGSNVLSDGGADTGAGATLHDSSTGGGDTFMVSNTSDTVTEDTAGTGVIESSKTWSLLSHTTGVNDLTLTGSSSTATANAAGNNILTDNTGDGTNTLDAHLGGGSDTLIGGNDVMKLGAAAQTDTVEFNGNTAYNGVANIENFNVANDTLNIDSIISNAGNASISYKLVADTNTPADTDLLVDYNITNHSYGYVQVGIFTGSGVTFADLNGSINVT